MTDRCRTARDLAQRRLDGELDPAAESALDSHLAICPSCREFVAGLETVREGLRALPEHPLPGVSLEDILDRTVRRERERPRAAVWAAWATAAAAATIVLSLILIRPGPPAAPAGDELARARRDAGIALSLTAGAMREAERTACDRVITERVAPALHRIPVRWSAFAASRKP